MNAMPKFVEDAGDHRLEDLADALFHKTGIDGVYGRTGLYEGVVEALDDPDARRFAQVKLLGSIPYADRESLLKRATEMFK